MAKKVKLLAVAYGDDGLAGDSGTYPSLEKALPATEGSTFKELMTAWKEAALKELGGRHDGKGSWTFDNSDGSTFTLCGRELDAFIEEQEGEIDDVPVGFWVLTAEDLETALVPQEIECWSDSQTYTVNRTVKHLCARLAKRRVGSRPAD